MSRSVEQEIVGVAGKSVHQQQWTLRLSIPFGVHYTEHSQNVSITGLSGVGLVCETTRCYESSLRIEYYVTKG